MTVLTRIVAAATLVSIALVDIAGASAAENYAIAAQRARARHHERAAHVNAVGGEIKKRDSQKRCKPATTTLTSHTHAATSSAHHEVTTTRTTKTTAKAKPEETTSSKAPVKTQPPPSSGGSKLWIASGASESQLKKFTQGVDVAYAYNWGANPPDLPGAKPCTMLWGYKNLEAFRKTRDQYSDCIMGMNEINLGSQSGMSASEAISLWNKEIKPYATGITVAPSVTTATDGLDVLEEFIKGVGGADGGRINYLSAHVYDTDPGKVTQYLKDMYEKFSIPIILSETACVAFYGSKRTCTGEEAQEFVKEIVNFCQATEWMKGCAFFGVMTDLGNVPDTNRLMNTDGSPTALGKMSLGI